MLSEAIKLSLIRCMPSQELIFRPFIHATHWIIVQILIYLSSEERSLLDRIETLAVLVW